MIREEIARIIDPEAFTALDRHYCIPLQEDFRRMKIARDKADAIRALPAQGEPVALAREALDIQEEWLKDNAYRLGLRSLVQIIEVSFAKVRDAIASPSSPAPDASHLNSGECEPVVKSASGAGEAIFAECAKIAMEHVDNGNWDDPEIYSDGYDQACRDIVEAIKTRASNRKTMDAIADNRKGE